MRTLQVVMLEEREDRGFLSWFCYMIFMMMGQCASSIATSSSHNNGMDGEVVGSRPTIACVTLPIKKYIFMTMALHNLKLFSDVA